MVAGPLLWLQFIFLVFVGDRMAGVQSTIILTSKIKRDEHLIVAKTTRQMAHRMMWGGGTVAQVSSIIAIIVN